MRTPPLAAGSILVFLAACYRYTPVTDLAPAEGAVVRLDLSETGTARLGSLLGRNATAVEGTVLSRTDTSFLMSVSATRQHNEQPLTWAGEHVSVPREAVQTIETRSLNKKKTLLLASVAVIGAISLKAIVSSLHALAGGDDGGTPPPPPP
jgi:hypothetical protein